MAQSFFKISRSQDGNIITTGDAVCRLGAPADNPPDLFIPYCEWKWDGTEFTAKVDCLGFYSLFYFFDKDTLIVSPSPAVLISQGASVNPDLRALAVFYLIGWYVGEDTPFKQIKILPPGGELKWKDGVFSIRGRDIYTGEQANISKADAIKRYSQLFKQSMKKNLAPEGGKYFLPLSGGRDSRHILFELHRHNVKQVQCVTHGVVNSLDPDVFIAAKVAGQLGAQHKVIDSRKSPIRDQIQTFLLTHFCSDEHGQYLALRRYIREQQELCTIFDGIGGDILTRNKKFSDTQLHMLCQEGAWDEVVDSGLLAGNNRILKSEFADRASNNVIPLFNEARHYLIESVRRFSSTPDPWSSFIFWTRTRREIALYGTSILGDVAQVRFPYLDEELVRFSLSLPFSVTEGGKFHDEVIAADFPEFTNIPYEDSVVGVYSKRSIKKKLQSLIEGVVTAKAVFPSNLSTLLLTLSAAEIQKKQQNLLKWKLYAESVSAVSSPLGASKYITEMNRLEYQ